MIRQVSLLLSNGVGGVAQLSFSHLLDWAGTKDKGRAAVRRKRTSACFLMDKLSRFLKMNLVKRGGWNGNTSVEHKNDFFFSRGNYYLG